MLSIIKIYKNDLIYLFSIMLNLKNKNTKQNLSLESITNKTSNQNLNSKIFKIVGDNKHFSPANKEWKNSVYAYNKNNVRSLSVLDNIARKTIRGYFNLSNSKKIARSKRMRNLIRRSTIKRLFVSNPEIKQTSDKVMITVYTFDREKQFYLRKLYFYNKSLNLYKLWLKKTLSSVSLGAKRKKKNIYVKQTLNPLYSNSINVFRKTRKNNLNLTSRNKKNKTYIHKLLLNKTSGGALSLLNHPFNVTLLRWKRQKIQKKANVKLLNKIRKNYFYRLYAKKIRLALKKNRITYKHYMKKSVKKTRFSKSIIFNSRKSKVRIPYFNLKFKNEMKFFFFKLAYVKKFDYLRKLFFFFFMKYTLSLFKAKVNIYHKNMRNNELILEFTVNNSENNHSALQSSAPLYYKLVKNYSNNKIKLMQRINMELLQFLDLALSAPLKSHNQLLEAGSETKVREKINSIHSLEYKEKIYSLYEYFKVNYFLLFLKKSFQKELLALNYYTKFLINQYKFGKFIPGLKLLISRIYSKKVELNLVNLKYPYLNSDIYTETIASKLRKKLGLLKVLRRSIYLAKTPYSFFSVNNAANLNNIQSLTIFKSLSVKNLNVKDNELVTKQTQNVMVEDKIHAILNKIYPNSLAQTFNLKSFIALASKNNLSDKKESAEQYKPGSFISERKAGLVAKNVKVLNQIRYKWVTGVRLEGAGRLTRRFTASRSVFKFKYKGNLKNIDYSLKSDISKNNISTVLLRNYAKPSLQYSFAKSKKRIGAFGIKGWVNSY